MGSYESEANFNWLDGSIQNIFDNGLELIADALKQLSGFSFKNSESLFVAAILSKCVKLLWSLFKHGPFVIVDVNIGENLIFDDTNYDRRIKIFWLCSDVKSLHGKQGSQ